VTNKSALREPARRALHDGKLPSRLPDRMWGGPGAGEVCAVCAVPRTQVSHLLRLGHLPDRHPDRTWGGPASAWPAGSVRNPIRRDQFEMEIQFAYDGYDRRLDKFHLHVRCFAVWELERTADEPAPKP
jgi:hypothetical protein